MYQQENSQNRTSHYTLWYVSTLDFDQMDHFQGVINAYITCLQFTTYL